MKGKLSGISASTSSWLYRFNCNSSASVLTLIQQGRHNDDQPTDTVPEPVPYPHIVDIVIKSRNLHINWKPSLNSIALVSRTFHCGFTFFRSPRILFQGWRISSSYGEIMRDILITYHTKWMTNRNTPGTTRSSDPTDHLRLNTTNPGIWNRRR